MSRDKNLEANITAAKTAVNTMLAELTRFQAARDNNIKHECFIRYAAAFTSCKVFVENYLRRLYPDEKKVPTNITRDIRQLVADMEPIDRVTLAQLQKVYKDLDQLSRDAA